MIRVKTTLHSENMIVSAQLLVSTQMHMFTVGMTPVHRTITLNQHLFSCCHRNLKACIILHR